MSIGVTASGLERALACPASVVLPQVNTTTRYSTSGNVKHAFVRRVLRGLTVQQALVGVPEEQRATCEAIYFRRVAGDLTEIQSEQAWALDVETNEVRFLGENIGRAYPELGPNEVCGTEDLAGLRIDSAYVTADIKSGYKPVTACEDNAQVKFFARVHMLRHPELDVVEGRILTIRADGTVGIDAHDFTRFDLDCFGDELSEMRDRIAAARAEYESTGRAKVSRGSWCDYCPAKSACPAFVGLARAMASEGTSSLELVLSKIAALTPTEQGEVWERARGFADVAEQIIDALKSIAKQDPIPLADGKQLRETTYEKESFHAESAIALLRQLGATQEQIAALYRRTVVSQVRELKSPGSLVRKTRKARAA